MRSTTLTVAEGPQQVTFDGLPAQIAQDSITASVQGSASVQISGIEIRRKVLAEPPEDKVKSLESTIQTMDDQITELDSEMQVIKSQQTFLDSLRAGYAERTSKDFSSHPPGTADLAQMVEFIGQTMMKLSRDKRKVEIQKRELVQRKETLTHELSLTKDQHGDETRSVDVIFECMTSGNLTLSISYLIAGAHWAPIYDARLANDGKQVELHYKAIVTQQTGEAWDNVDLTLSTARTAVGGDPPQLYSWQIRLKTPGSTDTDRINIGGNSSGQQTIFVAGETPLAQEFNYSQIQQQQTSVSFHVSKKESIPSGPSPHTTIIMTIPLETDLEYMAVPKLSPHVYLRSQVKNGSQAPLLPGKMNVFLGSNFVGNSTIPAVAPSEDFRLYFGIDEDIRVKREETASKKEAGSFSGNRKSYAYKITVENFKKSAQRINILDQVPVSDNEKLEVKMKDINPTPVEQDTNWMLKWILDVNSGEKREIRFGFDVEYPKDRLVDGL